jgi:hypothetical protein
LKRCLRDSQLAHELFEVCSPLLSISTCNLSFRFDNSRFAQSFARKCEELLSNLVFEACRSCGDLVGVCGFNSVFERDACDDFG